MRTEQREVTVGMVATHKKTSERGTVNRIVFHPMPEDTIVVVRMVSGMSRTVGLDQFELLFRFG